MAPSPTYAAPHVQLGRLMVAARRRGVSFEEWWEEAMRPGASLVMQTHPNPPAGAVRWPTDRADRVAWQQALTATREAWRGSFMRRPATSAERALGVLAPQIDRMAGEGGGDGMGGRKTLRSAA